jgi:hypothetical protein
MKKIFFYFFLFMLCSTATFAQDDDDKTIADDGDGQEKTDSVATKKMPPPAMTYEQLFGEFQQLRNTPDGTPLKEMQSREKRLRELRDNANYLVRYMVDPLKAKAGEIQKLEAERAANQKEFAAQEEAYKRSQQSRTSMMDELRNSKSKRSQQALAELESDSTSGQTDSEDLEMKKSNAQAATGKLSQAEQEYAKMKKELAPKEKLAGLIRAEWAKLNNRILTQTETAGVDATKSFETLTLEQIYDVATKQPKLEVIQYFKDNLFYSKKPPQINCKSGAGANWLKGIPIDEKIKQQGCLGYVSSLNKNEMYNFVVIKLLDGTVYAILWGKNNEAATKEDEYKAGAIKVW